MSKYPLDLAALPLSVGAGEQTRYYHGNIVGRIWPVSDAAALLDTFYISYKGIDIALVGDVAAYVARGGLSNLQARLVDLLKKLLGGTGVNHRPEVPGQPGDSIVDQNLTMFSELFVEPGQFDLSDCHVGVFRRHVLLRSAVIFSARGRTIGHVLIRRNARYDFDAWRKATKAELEQYSEAPGYAAAMKVLNAAEDVYNRSFSGDIALWINQDVILPETARWVGYTHLREDGQVWSEQQLADGILYHHPFRSPVFGNATSGNLTADNAQNQLLTAAYREIHASYHGVNSLVWRQPSVPDHGTIDASVTAAGEGGCSILAACLSSDTTVANVGAVIEASPAMLGTHSSRVVHSFQQPHEGWSKLLASVWPDLKITSEVTPWSETELLAWHIKHVKLDYRDAQGDVSYSPDLLKNEGAAEAFIKKMKAESAGKLNLIKLPQELGNTLALYSYCVNEALGEFDTWSDGEFLSLLWDAHISWAKPGSDIDLAMKNFCTALGVPAPALGKLSLRGGRHFRVNFVDFETSTVTAVPSGG